MLVDEATGEVQWAVQAHSLGCWVRVAMSPNGRFVASVGWDDNDWKIWDAASGELHMVTATHNGTGVHSAGMFAVVFSPCGQRLATRCSDGAVILWDARTGEAEHRMQGHTGFSTAIAFSADGACLASGGHMSIDVFDATTGAWLRTIEEHGLVTCVSFSPTAISILAIATAHDAIHVWDIDSGEILRDIAGQSMISIFSPDAHTIATASAASLRDVQLIDVGSGEIRCRMVGDMSAVYTASWCPYDGRKLASGSLDGTCKVWDSTTGALLKTIEFGNKHEKLISLAWGRSWVQGAMAFGMGHHPRLGAGSQMLELEAGVVRMILDRV